MPDEYDLIIIGGGPAGEHAAGRAAAAKLSVVLVESELVGGECSYWACMPSKTLLRPGHVLAAAHNVPGATQAVTGVVDVTAALARRDWMTADFDDKGQVDWLSKAGIGLVRGHARITGERLVEVETPDGTRIELAARKAVLVATGSAAAVPPIPGLAESRFWDNRGATASKFVPRRLLVLGGGAVGVELAQAWKRLGSQDVTVVEASERLLAREEPFAGELLAAAFSGEGITVLLGKKVVAVARPSDDGPVTLTLDDQTSLVGDELLVAVGRRPRTSDLGLESIGLESGKVIEVDDTMCAAPKMGGKWLYAVGDVNGRALLTHMGKYQARLAVDTILGHVVHDLADHGVVPRVVFTDPQIASVGLTAAEAVEQGHKVRLVSCATNEVPAAEIAGENTAGRCQLVVNEEDELILGATFTGPEMGESLHAATIAIIGQVSMTRLRHAVPAFPSFSEIWLQLVEAYAPTPKDPVAS